MMEQKYKLNLDISLKVGEKTLYVIEAVRDFGDVRAGDLGGFVEDENNLSHEGDCWIYDAAMAYGKGRVNRNAKIKDQARVYDYATVSDNAVVSGCTEVFQRAVVYGEAEIEGQCMVYGNAQVFGQAQIRGNVKVHDDAWVYGDVAITGYANVTRKCTQAPIVLNGFTYGVTIMDDHMSIDCQTKTFDEWRAVTAEEAFAMRGTESLEFFNDTAKTLHFLMDTHRKKTTNV